jgi:hypothetical protein
MDLFESSSGTINRVFAIPGHLENCFKTQYNRHYYAKGFQERSETSRTNSGLFWGPRGAFLGAFDRSPDSALRRIGEENSYGAYKHRRAERTAP